MPSALSQCAPCNSIQTHKIHFPKYQIHIPKNKLAFGNTKSTGSALGAFSITDSRLASQFGGLHNLPTLGVGGNDVYEDLKQSFYVGSLPRWWLWRLLNLGYIGWLWAWRFWKFASPTWELPGWFGALFPRWSAPECPFECGGRGVQSLKGQCPNAFGNFFRGASHMRLVVGPNVGFFKFW